MSDHVDKAEKAEPGTFVVALHEALLRERFGRDYERIMAGPSGPAWQDPESDFGMQAQRLAEALATPLVHLLDEARADAWDEGHRFTGYAPERDENPYRRDDR